jgi:hypothetical protein
MRPARRQFHDGKIDAVRETFLILAAPVAVPRFLDLADAEESDAEHGERWKTEVGRRERTLDRS